MAPLLLLVGVACAKKRDPAPAEMEEIARFMLRVWDDEQSLENGMDNLAPWLESNMRSDAALEGFRLGDLIASDLDTMERPDRSLEGLLGAAVAGVSAFPVVPHAESILLEDQVFSNPRSYDFYTREVEGDLEAFLSGEGAVTTVSEIQTSRLGVTIPYTLRKDYRWVRGAEAKPAIIARAWIPEKGCNAGGDNCLEQSFSIDVFYELDGSETGRFTATWSEVTSPFAAFLTDTQLVSSLASGMADVFTDVDDFMASGGLD